MVGFGVEMALRVNMAERDKQVMDLQKQLQQAAERLTLAEATVKIRSDTMTIDSVDRIQIKQNQYIIRPCSVLFVFSSFCVVLEYLIPIKLIYL